MELQAIERPSPGRGATPDNQGTDTIELIATYRPGGGTPEQQPVGYAFRVTEERVDDLRAHLQQQPEILCEGEPIGGPTSRPLPTAPSFEGQQGRRVPADTPITGGRPQP